jgi:hypothetical protein
MRKFKAIDWIKNLSISQIELIMLIVTAFAPQFVGFTRHWEGDDLLSLDIVFIAFMYSAGTSTRPYYSGITFLNPDATFPNTTMTGLSILFGVAVIYYCRGKVSRKTVYLTAILSILLPFYTGIAIIISCLSHDLFVYSGPIPIQILIGLSITHFTGLRKDDSWIGSKSEETWWEKSSEVKMGYKKNE